MGKLINTDDIPWDVEGVGFIPVIGKDEIDAMPEAVVRCKDCLWWGGDEEDPSGQRQCTENIGTYWDANSFCSWGERREDG